MELKFKIPIRIEKINRKTEDWEPYIDQLRANINKKRTDNEYLDAGAVQTRRTLVFEVRYQPLLKEISHEAQLFRIMYDGGEYQIVDYDDFQERHKVVKLLGVHV